MIKEDDDNITEAQCGCFLTQKRPKTSKRIGHRCKDVIFLETKIN